MLRTSYEDCVLRSTVTRPVLEGVQLRLLAVLHGIYTSLQTPHKHQLREVVQCTDRKKTETGCLLLMEALKARRILSGHIVFPEKLYGGDHSPTRS